jgi:excinuclease ABC subunit C
MTACLGCCTSSRWTLHRHRRGHLGGAGARRARLREPGHGARRAAFGRPGLLSGACGRCPRFAGRSKTTQPPVAVEIQVLEAFMAQHYIGIPVPAVLLITSVAVDKVLVAALSQQAGLQNCGRAQAPRAAPCVAGDEREKRRHQVGPSAWPKKARNKPAPGPWPMRWIWRSDDLDTLHIECFDISHTAGENTQALLRGVSPAQDAKQRIPSLQHRGHHAGRRLRRHAPSADAPLRQGGRGTQTDGSGEGTARCPTWC